MHRLLYRSKVSATDVGMRARLHSQVAIYQGVQILPAKRGVQNARKIQIG